ncbi:hypothetical protein ATANTOWER_025280 [Ataeniobius toweri]|uniref:Uncharacterized protein n=1 Tax=Ataeniobius toweri TaxID=208326 RepID=A0ABU7B4U9_9TELE|nr:hypothetical protein [Ataeniobius toweri]
MLLFMKICEHKIIRQTFPNHDPSSPMHHSKYNCLLLECFMLVMQNKPKNIIPEVLVFLYVLSAELLSCFSEIAKVSSLHISHRNYICVVSFSLYSHALSCLSQHHQEPFP